MTDRLLSPPVPWAAIKTAMGSLSLDPAVISQDAAAYLPGTVLGCVTATGKLARLDPAATDGSEVVAAVLPVGVDATGGDQNVGVIARLAEVWAHHLVWPAGITDPQKTAAAVDLAQVHIIIRTEG